MPLPLHPPSRMPTPNPKVAVTMPTFPPETVPVTVDGHRFVGRLQRDLGSWGTYLFEQGFCLYLSADEATDAAFLAARMLTLKGRRWAGRGRDYPKRM